jgi:hypothetical protein
MSRKLPEQKAISRSNLDQGCWSLDSSALRDAYICLEDILEVVTLVHELDGAGEGGAYNTGTHKMVMRRDLACWDPRQT